MCFMTYKHYFPCILFTWCFLQVLPCMYQVSSIVPQHGWMPVRQTVSLDTVKLLSVFISVFISGNVVSFWNGVVSFWNVAVSFWNDAVFSLLHQSFFILLISITHCKAFICLYLAFKPFSLFYTFLAFPFKFDPFNAVQGVCALWHTSIISPASSSPDVSYRFYPVCIK